MSDRTAGFTEAVQTDVDTLTPLVGEWLSFEQAAARLGTTASQVRSLVRAGQLVAVRPEPTGPPLVPAGLIVDGAPVKGLAGTLTVLRDAGYDDQAAVRWLFTPDPSLPGSPAEALRADRKTEVRRRAQALAF